MLVWLAGLDAGLASGALLSQMRQLATYSRPKGRGRRALKEAWVKSTGGTLGNERGVNRQSFKPDRSLKNSVETRISYVMLILTWTAGLRLLGRGL